ncbi:MBL fold metallo-hydrolase [Mucilaginibacter sp. HD30]
MKHKHRYFKVAPGIWGMKILFVNIYMVASDSHWVLIDAGLAGSAKRILTMADDLFNGAPPSAILLTHGHFDHRGALATLLKTWDVPVFDHPLELPYLTGRSAYPPPDPTVGGGLMSLLSFFYPKQPINVGKRLWPLPGDGSVPYLPEWEVLLVPGHAPGQVAMFRRSDRVLIAGDAFVTTKQESVIAAFNALPALNGPPKYFTYDWDAALASVIRLKKLSPQKAAAGHGPLMSGEQLRLGLEDLVKNFEKKARPGKGRYVPKAAIADERGVVEVPPPVLSPIAAFTIGLLTLGTFLVIKRITDKNGRR